MVTIIKKLLYEKWKIERQKWKIERQKRNKGK